MVRSPRSGRLEPSGTIGAFILRDAATRLLRMRFGGFGAVKTCGHVRLPPRPTEYGSAISRHDLPELWPWLSPKRGSRECRMRAAPAVSRAMGRRKRTRAYRFSGGTPTFPAQWLYGLYRALPGRAGLVVTVAGGIASANLTPASGRQDHTTSPYAAPSPLPPTGEMPIELKGEGLETPVVCANVGPLTGEPALRSRSRPTPLRPPHPTPRP
jgi:hypothetical protein